MEQENKNKFNVYFPIIIFLTLTIGFLLGRLVYKENSSVFINTFSSSGTDKISKLLDLIDQNYVDTVSVDKLTETAINKILAELDPHSIYIPAVDYAETQEPLDGSFEGIGVQFNVQNDTILIISVISGGPSEKEGLLAGDRIITINDSLFAGKEITSDDVVKNLKGEKGTVVKLGIKRQDIGDLLFFEITRDKIPLYSVDASYMYDDEIGYIKISRFAQTTYTEFMEAVKELKSQGLKKLILDLRGNSGGYLIEATDIADEFLTKDKMIVYTEGKARPKSEYFATDKDECEDIELVILIDTWSASASEILSGAIQDNDRGTIIGRRSYGKGLVQEPISFEDGSSIRLTVARYYTPTGRSIQKSYGKDLEDYDMEIYDRITNGELEEMDSTLFADSLKFVTAGGKVVYGGGGIMPDIFVAVDTTGYTNYFETVSNKSLIYKFALEWVDNNRSDFSNYKTAKQVETYLNSIDFVSKFKDYAEKNGVKDTKNEFYISKEIIKVQLYAYVVRNILGEDDFYRVYHQIDNVFLRAIEELEK